MVTPEVSSIAVLIAGKPHAPIGVNCSEIAGPEAGHSAAKPGHNRITSYNVCYTKLVRIATTNRKCDKTSARAASRS